MRRYERASMEDSGKLLADTAAVTALLDRLLHHGHVLKCGPKSYRTHHAGTAADAIGLAIGATT